MLYVCINHVSQFTSFLLGPFRSLKEGFYGILQCSPSLSSTGGSYYVSFHCPIFAYPQFYSSHEQHQYPICGQISKPLTCIEHYTDLSETNADDKLSTKEFWH
jgi:hypothetical protein